MADAGARLFIVGFESGDPQILKNIKKGATVEQAREFTFGGELDFAEILAHLGRDPTQAKRFIDLFLSFTTDE